jgi:hypothetical protein|tara:strand:+ start:1578 stop:1967 length:390 start_codon:yes stop_codon:yes gene_type:complete
MRAFLYFYFSYSNKVFLAVGDERFAIELDFLTEEIPDGVAIDKSDDVLVAEKSGITRLNIIRIYSFQYGFVGAPCSSSSSPVIDNSENIYLSAPTAESMRYVEMGKFFGVFIMLGLSLLQLYLQCRMMD